MPLGRRSKPGGGSVSQTGFLAQLTRQTSSSIHSWTCTRKPWPTLAKRLGGAPQRRSEGRWNAVLSVEARKAHVATPRYGEWTKEPVRLHLGLGITTRACSSLLMTQTGRSKSASRFASPSWQFASLAGNAPPRFRRKVNLEYRTPPIERRRADAYPSTRRGVHAFPSMQQSKKTTTRSSQTKPGPQLNPPTKDTVLSLCLYFLQTARNTALDTRVPAHDCTRHD